MKTLIALVLAGAAGAQTLVLQIAGEAEGTVKIALDAEGAPAHAERIVALTEAGFYDGVVFHRVIDNFMAQTGDGQYGRAENLSRRVGTGGSDLPDLPAEFGGSFTTGTVGMARSAQPNSANSQFFIMFAPAPHLNGQYTVVGEVTEGMDIVAAIKRGSPTANGAVTDPDVIVDASIEP